MTSDGSAAPLVWLPILNPLDAARLLAFIACAVWLRRLRALGVRGHPRAVDYAELAALFLWFNALLLRTLHHWTGVPYRFGTMSHSMPVQASVSVFWTLCALAMMLWATRRASRLVWFSGGALQAATVVKLFPVRPVARDGPRADRNVYRYRFDVAADRLLLTVAAQGRGPGN